MGVRPTQAMLFRELYGCENSQGMHFRDLYRCENSQNKHFRDLYRFQSSLHLPFKGIGYLVEQHECDFWQSLFSLDGLIYVLIHLRQDPAISDDESCGLGNFSST